jgi:hypothetical protein
MSSFSNFVNSFLQIFPFSWLPGTDNNKDKFASLLDTTTAGMLRRQGSNMRISSNLLIDSNRPDYSYDIDACQTIYLVEKHSDKKYEVTILYTKEFRPFWLDKKLKMIMLRIMVAEQNIPVLNEIFIREGGWKIIGSIDCQKDRSYSVNQFHQDNLLTSFIDNIYEPFFVDFLHDIFSPRPEFFSPTDFPGVSLGIDNSQNPNSFRVYNPNTSHFGTLDYDSPVSIIAAAIKTATEYIFTILPPSTDNFRPFLFYLNSIIHHATPSSFTEAEISEIIAYYTANPGLLPPEFTFLEGGKKMIGGAREGSLRKALEDYNIFFNEAIQHPRNFRRLLGKIMPTEETRNTNFPGIIREKRVKIMTKYEKDLSKLEIEKTKPNSMYTPERIKRELAGLEIEKDRKISEASEYKSIEEMTSILKAYYYDNSTYKYPEDTENLKSINARVNNYGADTDKKEKKRKESSKPIKEILFEIDETMNDNYFVYASHIFSQEEALTMLHTDIEYVSKYPSAEKASDEMAVSSSSDARQINIIRLPLDALGAKGGKSRCYKSKIKTRKKAKYNFKKGRFTQRINNKKRRLSQKKR